MQLREGAIKRVFQPIILGSLSNIIVNYVFDPENPDFLVSEFIVAILLALPVTELNHYIDRRLEAHFSWTKSFKKRFIMHLGLLSISVLLVFNISGSLYVMVTSDEFLSLKEIIIINLVLFGVLFLISFFNWAYFFYQGWKKTESKLELSREKIKTLHTNYHQSTKDISLIKGKSQLIIPANELRFAKSEAGIVWVKSSDTTAIYSGTLQSLMDELPDHLFFLATRGIILHREVIKSISPSSYGKIDLTVDGLNNEVTVSIQKAAAFRKWYHSTSS